MAFTDDISALTDIQCLPHVVIGDKHTDAAVFQMGNDLFDVGNRYRINTGKGFVK